MPEAKLNVVIDSSKAKAGAQQVTQAMKDIKAQTDATIAGMRKMEEAQERNAKMMRNMASAVKVASTAWVLYKAVISKVIKNSIEQERMETQLDAVLKSTGHSAGLTATQIKNLASEMQNLTAYGDEEVLGMQNILLTFKQIKGDEFKGATMAVLDLATAMGTDLKGAAIQVGKALNDPKIGLTALQRVGITFTDSQKDVIKKLTETGKVAEAQKIILKELESQFGGSAKAATTTLGGAIKQLQNKFGDLFEINATGEFSGITTAVNQLTAALDTEPVKKFAAELGKMVAGGVTNFTNSLKVLADNITLVKNAMVALSGIALAKWVLPLLGLAGVPGAIAGGMAVLYANLDKTAKGLETLSERRGLGTNISGKSGETANQRLMDEIHKKGYGGREGIFQKAVVASEYVKPKGEKEEKAKGGKTQTEILIQGIQDQIKYMGALGTDFLPVLDSWKSKLKELTPEWKAIVDLQTQITDEASGKKIDDMIQKLANKEKAEKEAMNALAEGNRLYYETFANEFEAGFLGKEEYLSILQRQFKDLSAELEKLSMNAQNTATWTDKMWEVFGKIQTVGGEGATKAMESLRKQFEHGTISQAEYTTALEAMKVKFESMPAVVKAVDVELEVLHENMRNKLPSVFSQVQASWDSMEMALAQVPDRMGDAFTAAIIGSQSLSESLLSLLQDIGKVIVKAMIMNALFGKNGTSGLLGGLFAKDGAVVGGGVSDWHDAGNSIKPFASGGIVNKPTLFPFAGGIGLMGEAGAEAIMPLKRGSDGKLGVEGGGGGGTMITMNINAVDSKSFVDMMRSNGAVGSLVIENIYRNGSVRKAIQQGV